jgi:hypothetical protein
MLTAETIDTHLDQHTDALDTAHAMATDSQARSSSAGLNPAQAVQAVCAAHRAVRPILLLVVGFPFFRQSWKDALAKYTTTLDALCP